MCIVCHTRQSTVMIVTLIRTIGILITTTIIIIASIILERCTVVSRVHRHIWLQHYSPLICLVLFRVFFFVGIVHE